MEAIKVKGIVTRTTRYGERDMLVTLVTLEHGVLTCTARGCLKPNAKLRYAAEPLNFGDYVLQHSGKRYIISECSQIESFNAITLNIENYYIACFLLEALQKTSATSNPEMMDLTLRSLNTLAYDNVDPMDVCRDFLLKMLEINGDGLNLNECSGCGCDLTGKVYFSNSDGLLCEHCSTPYSIPVETTIIDYLRGENKSIEIKRKSNMFLTEVVYKVLGIKISNHYIAELR